MVTRRHSELAQFLRAQMLNRGWSLRDTQRATGVSKTALYNMLDKEDVVPELDTILKLANNLEIPLWRVIELCGFDLQLPDSGQSKAERLDSFLERAPELQSIVDRLLTLSPADLESVLVFLEGLQLRRERQNSIPKPMTRSNG